MVFVKEVTSLEDHDNGQLLRKVDEQFVILPRGVKFDWSALPHHYVYSEPFVTHFSNLLHLLLPAGEAFFIEVLKESLPLIKDAKLYNDIQGFIGQETIHSTAHQGVLDFFAAKGIHTKPYTDQIHWMLRTLFGPRPHWSKRMRQKWLLERIAVVAAIEHYTAIMGKWVINAHKLDDAMDPTMLDMLRWHGAEEVEHHAVAYDVMRHLGCGYWRSIRAQLITTPLLLIFWARGMRYMYAIDKKIPKGVKPRWRDWWNASRRGLLPGAYELLCGFFKYFKPSFHPDELGGMDEALEYLSKSPAARASY